MSGGGSVVVGKWIIDNHVDKDLLASYIKSSHLENERLAGQKITNTLVSVNKDITSKYITQELFLNNKKTYLIEEHLFFKQFNFHKQKLVFHRSSMKNYENYLLSKGIDIAYIETKNQESDIRIFLDKINVPEDRKLPLRNFANRLMIRDS